MHTYPNLEMMEMEESHLKTFVRSVATGVTILGKQLYGHTLPPPTFEDNITQKQKSSTCLLLHCFDS